MTVRPGDVVRLENGDEMVVLRLHAGGAEVFLNVAGKIYVQKFAYELLRRAQ